MRFDVYADLDHLYMLNFSVDARRLAGLVPPPLRVLQKRGRGFPSIVLPCIRRLRPVLTRFPAVDYELCGMRILVEYDSPTSGLTKGIYFARLIMDPDWVRRVANMVTAFRFERGEIEKRVVGGPEMVAAGATATLQAGHACDVSVRQHGRDFLRASVQVEVDFPDRLTPGSVFTDSNEALATYNDISYGFIPAPDGREVKILQIADPYPDYVAWPLVSLTVHEAWTLPLHEDARFAGSEITLEPSYYIGWLQRYWRWRASEPVKRRVPAMARVPGSESVT
jgi:hypothetical protein